MFLGSAPEPAAASAVESSTAGVACMSRDEIRSVLQHDLKAKQFDLKRCLALASALKRSGIDAIAAMDLDRWMRQLRDIAEDAPTPVRRAKLAAALGRINLGGSAVAIRNRRCAAPDEIVVGP
jgi:hypothetical protein